jgi:hypothetical protein
MFAIGAYIAFLLISVVPLFADAVNPANLQDRRWFDALWFGIHSLYLSWIITGLNVAAFYFQAKESLSRPSDHALSRRGLLAQAVIFALVAVSWIWRVRFPYDAWEGMFMGLFSTWYELVGWAAVDNAIFALVQALLLWVTSRHVRPRRAVSEGETEPLLHA